MNKIDHILDNEVFLDKLEEKLLLRHRENPQDSENFYRLGETYRKKGNLTQALHFYKKYLAVYPNHHGAIQLTRIFDTQTPAIENPTEGYTACPFWVIHDFLPDNRLMEFESIVEENEPFFNFSNVSDAEKVSLQQDKRKSKVLHRKHFQAFSDYFTAKLLEKLTEASAKTGINSSLNGSPELQMTMHLGGDFFKTHSDVLHQGIGKLRQLTFVYYYHSKQKQFEGGNLLLFDTDKQEQKHNLNYTKIAPVRNSIVFFPSYYFHKVTPINLLSDNYRHGRYTVNGWFH